MNERNAPLSVSVVIPTYNEPARLRATLQSLCNQEFPAAAAQIVVVDDASVQLPGGLLDDLVCPFPLKLIRHSTNQGRAQARNTGLGAAEGELIVFLDSDMTVEPDFLKVHTAVHKCYSNRVVIGNIRFAPQLAVNPLTRYLDSRGVHRLAAGQSVPFNYFVTGNASAPRRLLVEAGLFDERFTAYGGEDLELGYRLHRQGVRFHYAPQALSWHHHLRTLDQLCQLMNIYGKHSLPLLMQKHPELAPLLRLDFLDRTGMSSKKLLLRIAISPLIYQLVRLSIQAAGQRWIPNLFFDYLLWSNRTRGYLEAVQMHQSA